MHTITVKDPVLADQDAGLLAVFEMLCERMGKVEEMAEMLCERMGKLEEMAEHWLRRKREKEWEQDGKVDRQLLTLDRDVELWRGAPVTARPMKVVWSAVNIAMQDGWMPANLEDGEKQRSKTEEAMKRLGIQGVHLWTAQGPVRCTEVGLDSDFRDLIDAVSEEMLKEAVRAEGEDLSLVGYGSVVQPSVFLQTRAARAPEYWVKVGSRIFEFCGIPPSALELHPLAPNVMRVVAAYERSMNAPPAKKRPLLDKSKRLFERANRYSRMEEAFRNCELFDYDDMLADFQRL